ncbi:hypothetical protein [Amaricoccus macauensis]|uniref:hypothetical protein n=1 Tax=Amaricoccus macauensis TaxID=57001 RepID=UPI003C7E948C
MNTMTQAAARLEFPVLNRSLIVTLLLAGLAADIAWEVWARGITPLLIGGPLEPSALVRSVFGIQSKGLSEAIHIITGLVFYPIGYLFIVRPLQKMVLPSLPALLTGAAYGVALWVFALYVMAHLVAGFPPFLNFGNLAWVSLAGHVLYGVIVALVVDMRARRA